MRTLNVVFKGAPWRNRRFKVRGICKCDILNPCWDNRPDDVPGKHWAGGRACEPCTVEAFKRLKR